MPTQEERDLWNTDPDAAYAEAERRVEEALASGATELRLGGEDEWGMLALSTLPTRVTELSTLTVLDLSHTKVAEAAPLANLTNLQDLYLANTQVADAAPLANLTNLRNLDLSSTQVADTVPLANLTNLQILNLSVTNVMDAGPIANLTNLIFLSLKGTQVTDSVPLSKLMHLQILILSYTKIENVAPLAKLTDLHTIDLDGTNVTDLTPLRDLDSLGSLYYGHAEAVREAVLTKLVELDQPECTIQTLQYLNGTHPEYGGPPEPPYGQKKGVETQPAPETSAPDNIVKIAAPSDFKLTDDQIDVQLDPVAPAPQNPSRTPINEDARSAQFKAVHGIAKEVNLSLKAYKFEGEESNRVRPAAQIARGARLLTRQTEKDGEAFVAPLFYRTVEAVAVAWFEDSDALEAYDREMILGLLELARKLYPFYPVLVEIDSPYNADLIPDDVAETADSYVGEVYELVHSIEGGIVFTDKTREVVDGEMNATTPPNTDARKWKMARFGALVGKMKEKLDAAKARAQRAHQDAPTKEDVAVWATVSGAVERLWQLVAPFIGL